MGPIDFLVHLLNFLAPALALALLMPLCAGLMLRRAKGAAPLARPWEQALAVGLAGAAVLAGGLWWFGRDGKMATYATLVLVAASVQWLVAGGWRR